jgi:hypothetical protein
MKDLIQISLLAVLLVIEIGIYTYANERKLNYRIIETIRIILYITLWVILMKVLGQF